jgi:hypothetical protein
VASNKRLDSTHSVTLEVLPALSTTETWAICTGDSLLIFGQWQSQAGVFSQLFSATSGCDSTHSVTLEVLPALNTTETRVVCTGDSLLIFGQWQSQAGVFSQLFSATGGCDSTHSVTLEVLPALSTTETWAICTGDSLLIFGQWQSQAGVFSQLFSATGGCDSTHSVTLEVLPALSTTETRAICTGDSLLIFGQWQSQAGVFSQLFSATSGCDSTHSVTLEVLPALSTTETRVVCTGDSLLIFGQWQSQAGVFSQLFSATGGCDSTHSVTLEVLPLPEVEFEWTPPSCFGESDGSMLAVTTVSGLEYSLNGSDFQPTGHFTQLAAGEYLVEVRDLSQCILHKSVVLPDPLPLTLELPGDTLLQPGQAILLLPQTNGSNLQFTWSPTLFLSCFDCLNPVAIPEQSMTYTLLIQNEQGCTAIDSIQVLLKELPIGVFIPNAIQSGSSSGNGLFTVFAPIGVREVLLMEVYDRWGELLFRQEHFSADGTVGWDGTSRGETMLPGVYVYRLEIVLEDGTKKQMKEM